MLYTDGVGRPSVAPGRYFGSDFEGLDSERAIAWRAADSLSIRQFLEPEPPPDHSTVSRTRRLIDLETHQAVFTWVLQRSDAQLVKGRTLGVRPRWKPTLRCGASCAGTRARSTKPRDSRPSGIATPLVRTARFDRKRAGPTPTTRTRKSRR